MEFLNEEEIQEFTEAFKVFDSKGKGLIVRSDLEIVMKATGQNPTAEEIEVRHPLSPSLVISTELIDELTDCCSVDYDRGSGQ